FGTPAVIAASSSIGWAQLAVASASGRTAIAWSEPTPSSGLSRVAVVTRPEGGTFSTPQILSDPARHGQVPSVAMSANGDAVIDWMDSTPRGEIQDVQASVAPDGEPFGAATTVSGPAGRFASVAIDLDGGALA